ncbi:MAG: DciA family protein [Hyphomonadaceae bacterium]
MNATPDWKQRQEERAALEVLKSVRTRAAYTPGRSLNDAISRALAPILKEAGPAAGTLEARWPEIVGPRLAKVTRPIKVAPGKGGSTLHLQASSAAAAMIQHAEDHIRERVGLATGAKIKAIRIIQTTTPKPKAKDRPAPPLTPAERASLTSALGDVKTPRVREALEQLGEAVLSARKSS